MNKRHLHHIWTKIRPVSYWYFLAAFFISLSVSVYALRQNNLQMIKLRDIVNQTDQQNGDVETALRNLRVYIFSHMNTNLASGPTPIKPPIQLKYRYERLLKTEQDKAAASNTKIYKEAQSTCEQRYPADTGGPRAQCIQDYMTSHGIKEQPIQDGLYKFDFVSPSWTPDLAGWGLVATAIFLFLFLLRYCLEKWAKTVLNSHY